MTEEERTASLSKTLGWVRKLIERAEHETTPPEEAKACRERADALMLKYAIDEATVEATRPAEFRGTPVTAEFAMAPPSEHISVYVGQLASAVAKHTRCKIDPYSRYDSEAKTYMAKVYGFESDVRYFEILYTTLRLHMLGVLRPEWNPAETLDQNAYRLHNAGYNWLEIAKMSGWKKVRVSYVGREANERIRDMKNPWYNEATDEYQPETMVGSRVKRACQRETKRQENGARHRVIAANGAKTYRNSAAQGYANRISARLREAAAKPGGAGEIVLASRAQTLEDFFRAENASRYTKCPRCERLSANPYECEFCGQFIKDKPGPCPRCEANPSGTCRDHPRGSWGRPLPFNDAAYAAGTAHANAADIGTGSRVGSGRKGELS